jgi:hypothetical protein
MVPVAVGATLDRLDDRRVSVSTVVTVPLCKATHQTLASFFPARGNSRASPATGRSDSGYLAIMSD